MTVISVLAIPCLVIYSQYGGFFDASTGLLGGRYTLGNFGESVNMVHRDFLSLDSNQDGGPYSKLVCPQGLIKLPDQDIFSILDF